MDGDSAPLEKLVSLSQQHDAWLMADDAHGYGVLGERGAGVAEQYSQAELPIYMATLGKAIGSFGAFVAGSEALIESLIQFARSYIYTTALPPAVAATSLASLQLLSEESWRRSHLQQLIQQFKTAAAERGWPLMPSDTAIQPLLIGEADKALALSQQLLEKGIWVSAIRPPTVPAGTARLRITLSAAHSEAQLAQLIEALDQCLGVEAGKPV
jgi:8-amino-7-oxononanoate synthase